MEETSLAVEVSSFLPFLFFFFFFLTFFSSLQAPYRVYMVKELNTFFRYDDTLKKRFSCFLVLFLVYFL